MSGQTAETGRIPTASIVLRGKSLPIPAGQTLADALESLGLPAEMYLAIRDGALIPAGEAVRPGDEIRLVGVLAGG